MPTNNKLIRDRIPALLDAKGITYTVHTCDNKAAYEAKLQEKLLEECREYLGASPDERLEELADMMEVIVALVKCHGASMEQLEHVRLRKREERGGFDHKLVLLHTEQKEGE